RRSRYQFTPRFLAKRSDTWSERLPNSSVEAASAGQTTCEPQSASYINAESFFVVLTGRYRSGQTGQTVNLLALRLRWFESSPAQSLIPDSKILVSSSLATFATATLSTTAVAASTATRRSRFSRASLIHCQRPAFNGLTIEFRDGVLSVLFGTHGDKRKAARFAGEFVLHEGNFLHSAGL